jgi:hypothetical protein
MDFTMTGGMARAVANLQAALNIVEIKGPIHSLQGRTARLAS